MSDPRYPIGRFAVPAAVTGDDRERWIGEIGDAPGQLREAVRGLADAQFDTPYREGGWTIRHVVHHLPDSHLNAYTRFKLALTEDNPTIKPYDESRWAELADVKAAPIGVSLTLLEALHRRWVLLMRAMREEDWLRTFFHPEHQKALRLDRILAMYAWHGRHHVAHITTLRERMGWH